MRKKSMLPPMRQMLEVGVPAFSFALGFMGPFVGLASPLMYGFPVIALLVGYWLYRRNSIHYIGYMLWMWALAPEVRRVVDFRTSYHDTSPISLSPYLVTMLAGFYVLRRITWLSKRQIFPFFLLCMGVLYGYIVGLLTNGFAPATYDFLNWILPPVIGAYLVMTGNTREKALAQMQYIALTFGYMVLVLGIYGMIQFFIVPGWDALWMDNCNLLTIGSPVPLMVRVFGPMNSPASYGISVMIGLVTCYALPGRLRFVVTPFALAGIALSLVRTAWLGLVLAALYIVMRGGIKKMGRGAIGFALVVALLLPILSVSSIADAFLVRLQSFSNIKDDSSYGARADLYAQYGVKAVTDVVGEGLGTNGTAAKLKKNGVVDFDSGILNIPYTLGWLGGAAYTAGLTMLLVQALFYNRRRSHPAALIFATVFLVTMAALISIGSNTGVAGVFSFLAVAVTMNLSRHDFRIPKVRREAAAASPRPA